MVFESACLLFAGKLAIVLLQRFLMYKLAVVIANAIVMRVSVVGSNLRSSITQNPLQHQFLQRAFLALGFRTREGEQSVELACQMSGRGRDLIN